MDRELLAHFPVVLAVARKGGFAAAAASMNMSPSAVSHAVKTVEDRLGQPLFHRTTRSVALTEAGKAFIAALEPALERMGEAMEEMRATRGQVTGTLRINAPRIAMPLALTPVLAHLAQSHPGLTVEITGEEGLVDIVAGGFDAGVRLGEMIAEDMVAVRLTPPFAAITVASPGYVKAHGEPHRIADLGGHNCIGYRLVSSGGIYTWELREGAREIAVQVTGSARVTDPLHARELALAGVGIAYLFQPLVKEDLRAGRLRQLLPKSAIEEPGLFLYYPRRASDAPKLRAFLDVVKTARKAARHSRPFLAHAIKSTLISIA